MDASVLHEIARSSRIVGVRLSPHGDRVAFLRSEDGRTEAFIAASNGSGCARRLTTLGVVQPEYGDAGPAWSPEGTRVATLVPSEGGADVAIVSVDDGRLRVLTDGHVACASPRWSPDGCWLAFLVARKPRLRTINDPPEIWDVAVDDEDPRHASAAFGGVALWIASPDGSVLRRVALSGLTMLDFDWSPTSREIVAAVLDTRTAHGRLIRIMLSGQGQEIADLVESRGQQFRAPRFDANDRVAYLADGTGNFEAYVWSDGAEHQATSDGYDKESLVWARSGNEARLVYTRFDQGELRIESVNPDVDDLPIETLTTDGVARDLTVTTDGLRVAFVFESPSQPPEVQVLELASRQRIQASDSTVVGHAERLSAHFEPHRYRSSDGTEVEGFLALPQDGGGAPPPVVVYPHGGPTSVFMRGWNPFLAWLTKQGYAVFAPNFRGSTMYGRAFERANDHDWGGGDLDDVVCAVDALSNAGLVDRSRAAVFGGSYGGYLTLLALAKHPGVFRCGIDLYGVSNRYSSWLTTDRLGRHNMEKEMGPMALHREAYRDASPLYFVDRIEAPLLILHGEDDARVPLGQSEELVDALERAGVFHIYRSYPSEGHGFRRPEHVADAYARVTAFLASFL